MARKVAYGRRWIRWDKRGPRLVLHERYENKVKWTLRGLTAIGIITSLITLPTVVGFGLSVGLALLDAGLEKTAFYYTSLYATALPDFTYDPDKWKAMVFISFGPPSPTSDKIVGLVFSDVEDAKSFFDFLRAWNGGSSEDPDNNIRLTFVTDEDVYYVYLYPNPGKKSIRTFFSKLKRKNRIRKPGKEHFGIVMQRVICHGFETSGRYALGDFVDNQPNGKHFLLGPFLYREGKPPEPIHEIEPISKLHYKSKVPGTLTSKDFELAHWKKVVKR